MTATITAILLFCFGAHGECREYPLPSPQGGWSSLVECEAEATKQAKARSASTWRCRIRWDEPA